MKNIKNIFTLSSQRKNLNNTFLIPSLDRRGLGGGIKKLEGNTKAFTLVELIIVITILAILATIAFISFQGFAKNARDGNRLATLKQLQNGLEVFATKTGYYPDPEGNILTGSINGITFSNKGIFGDNSSRIIQASKTPTDPLNSSQYYIYALDSNKKQYQIATILETLNANNNLENNLIQETYAGNEGNYKSYVVGNYKGYIKYSSGSLTYLANIPSLIWNNTGSVDLLSGSTYFVANKSLNLPYKPNNDTNINISNGNEIVKFITGNQEGVLTGVNITPVISGTSVDSWLSSFGSNSGIILKSFTSLDNLSNGAKNLELAINGSVSVGNNGDTQDPYWNNVVSLLSMDDIGLTDKKGKSVSKYGNATRSSNQSKFGGYSAYFDGNGDYLSIPANNDFAFGMGDFTIEGWFYILQHGSYGSFLWCHNDAGGNPYVSIYQNKLSFGRTGAYPILSGITNINLNTWYHFAITRESGTLRIFLNGILEGTLSDSINYSSSSSNISIFTNLPLDNNWTGAGYIDELRITKGVARYTSNFTPLNQSFPAN